MKKSYRKKYVSCTLKKNNYLCSLISTLSKYYYFKFFFKYFKNYDNIKISPSLRILNHNSSLLNEYVVLKELKPQIYSNLNRQLPKERVQLF